MPSIFTWHSQWSGTLGPGQASTTVQGLEHWEISLRILTGSRFQRAASASLADPNSSGVTEHLSSVELELSANRKSAV